MNPGRFFMPNMAINPMMRNPYMFTRNTSIISRLFNNIRSINYGKILSGANKTLNVVNQTIPLIRQAGPLVNNTKNMLNIARAFNKETRPKKEVINKAIRNKTDSVTANNNPTFFV